MPTTSDYDEIADISMARPHVVLLGAGASRATCPHGDRHGNTLPLMQDLVEVLGLQDVLNDRTIDPDQNFEDLYSDLYTRNETCKLQIINNAVEEYFGQLELSDEPTIYDHLVLSLRAKDLIATFNWDPFLIQAYLRNSKAGLQLPKLAFLHGNVRIGYCAKHNVSGLAGLRCKKCNKMYERSPLLYPVNQKDYSHNSFISNEWKLLRWGLHNTFMLTIFGYSGPATDQEAIDAMSSAWGNKHQRDMEQTEFITLQNDDEISKNWDRFIHTHHYDLETDFYDSWLANHPRRSGEAYIAQYVDARFIDSNPIPRNVEFPELWQWFSRFTKSSKG